MTFPEEYDSVFFLARLRNHLRLLSESASTATCTNDDSAEECRDEMAALRLKLAAIISILLAGIAGIAIPFICRKKNYLHTDGGTFILAKAFAAGVILATGFVHMLHDAESALTDTCLPDVPWREFPFSGFVAMLAALGTLLLDLLATQFYEGRNNKRDRSKGKAVVSKGGSSGDAMGDVQEIVRVEEGEDKGGEEERKAMHIVGMHAHAAAHRHSHVPLGLGMPDEHGHDHGHVQVHVHVHGEDADETSHVRHVVVSQILELGIVSHSVIIGLSLGVSQSPCTIRPLIAALSFHQFFEGFALGGCIAQAQFKTISAILMSTFFVITTPAGIGAGVAVASFYNANSPRALVVEGLLDSVSAGILIYMALVDLIAADFISRRMSCHVRVQVRSYVALFLGAIAMSSLAIWA